jgi:glycine/D-amino acid oxidase-like deaminating enzyme
LEDLYALAPKGILLDLLQSDNESYFAVSFSKAGTTNSAHLTEELTQYLLQNFPSRFELFEESPVNEISLGQKQVSVKTSQGHQVHAKHVILCTNGFEKFKIKNENGEEIDKAFHKNLEGIVGYMSGFYENSEADPCAISYHGSTSIILKNKTEIPPYFYLTRRPAGPKKKLVCLGGPEVLIPSTHHYNKETHFFPKEAAHAMDHFLKSSYSGAPKHIDYSFLWHGLMGYTPTGMRCVGPDPKNPLLMYNLGCNGVGILSSIAGAKRVSEQAQGKKLEPSLFDPLVSMGKQKPTSKGGLLFERAIKLLLLQ